MSRSFAMRRLVIVAIITMLMSLGLQECNSSVEFINNTSQRVTVQGSNIDPHSSMHIPYIKSSLWEPNIRVVAEDGRVLLEEFITWREVKKMGRKIIITDPDRP